MTSASTSASATSSTRYAHYVLVVLTLANVLSVADRGIMGLLLEPIKRDLAATDTEMSLLTGVSFVLFYSLFGIPIARWADSGNRKNILSLGVAIWSLMTSLCGFVGNFALMAVTRAGVGMGEATCTPTAMSLISDYYERKARPAMIAVFNMGQHLSSFLITPLIGLVADGFGWRAAFIFLGVPGVIVALLVRFTIKEPVRGAADETSQVDLGKPTLTGAVAAMWRSKPFMLILIGTAITALGGSTLAAWVPALTMRAFGVTATQIASVQQPIAALAGLLGGIGGGFVTGWFAARRKSQRWIVVLPALISLITIPAGILVVVAPSWPWMVLGVAGGSFTIAFRTAPYLALSLELVPANCRGMAAAATLIASTVVGQALGPLAVGMISDYFNAQVGSVTALRFGMIFAPVTLTLGVIPFFMVMKYFDENGVKN